MAQTEYVYGQTSSKSKLHFLTKDGKALCNSKLPITQNYCKYVSKKKICNQCWNSDYEEGTLLTHTIQQKPSRAPKKRNRGVPKGIRLLLWEVTFGREKGIAGCEVCGSEITMGTFEAGHVTSYSDGGTLSLDNLRCICHCCNIGMEDVNLEDYKILALAIMERKRISWISSMFTWCLGSCGQGICTF